MFVRDRNKNNYFSNTFHSLGNKNFRLLFFGMVLVMAAINIQMLARGYFTWELTKSPIWVTLTGAGFAPPILIFSIFGGAISDRIERKKIIQLAQLGLFAIALFIAISIRMDSITVYHLLLASLLQGCIWAFLIPARQTLISQLVNKSELKNATALNSSGMSLMTLSSPALGGLIYGFYGPEIVYYLVSLLALFSIIFTSLIPRIKIKNINKNNVIYEMKKGLVYALNNKTVFWLLIIAMTTTLLAMPFRSLLPVQIDEIFLKGPEALGILLSMIGLGSLLGSLFIAGMNTNQSTGLILLFTSLITSIAIILNALITQYSIAIIIMIILGIGDAGRRTLNMSLIIENSDEEYRGRVMGIYATNFGLIPVGAIPLGFLAEFYNVRIAFASAGVLLLIFTLLILLSNKTIRKLR